MELRDVNYKVDNLINKSLNLLKSELLVEIKIKEEISEIYINAFEKIRVDLNRLRNVFLENKKLSSNEKEYIHNYIFDSFFDFNNSALELFNSAIVKIK